MSKIELDIAGVRKNILQADWMQSYIESIATQKAGSDGHVKSFIGTTRAVSIVYPNTRKHPQ